MLKQYSSDLPQETQQQNFHSSMKYEIHKMELSTFVVQ